MADMRIKAELVSLSKIINGLGSLEKKFATLEKKIVDTGNKAKKVNDAWVDSTVKSTKKATTQFGNMSRAAKGFAANAKSLGKDWTKAMDGAKSSTKRFSGVVGKLARNVLPALGVALGVAGIVGVFRKVTKAASDFEFGLAKVSTLITGDATKSMATYRKTLLSISKDTGESLGVLSQGLFDVISASVKGTETITGATNLLNVATKAGIAGASDTAVAVDALTTILNSYNLTATDSADISDKLFTIARLGKTNFGELAPALGPVVSIAAQAGVSFDELGASLIALTKGGLATREAVTAVRAVMSQALTPSKELNKAFKENFKDFKSIASILSDPDKGFVKFMEMLREVTGGSAEEMARLIPELRGLTGVATLAGTGIDNLRDGLEEMRNSTGAVEDAYGKMSETFEMKTRKFKALIESVLVKIGNKLLPVIMEHLENFGEWFDKNEEKVLNFFSGLTDLIGGVVKAVYLLTNAFKTANDVATGWAHEIVKRKQLIDAKNLEAEKFRKAFESMTPQQAQQGLDFFKQFGKGYEQIAHGVMSEFPMLVHEVPEAPAGKSEERKKRSEAEIKEALARRKAFLRELRNLEIAAMEEIESIRTKAEDRIAALRKAGGGTAKEMERAIGHIREEAEDKISEIYNKRDEEENKRIDKQHQKRIDQEERVAKERAKREKEVENQRRKFAEEVQNVEEKLRKQRVQAARESWESLIETSKTILKQFADFASEIFGSVFGKIKSQFQEIIQLGIQFASEGVKQLVLTEEDRLRIEKEIGRKLTAEEAKSKATAMSATELEELRKSGKIGKFDVVGEESPIDRLEPVLDKFVSFWENLAANLDGVLTWLDQVGAPRLIDAFVSNLPKLFKAINASWKRALPVIIDAIIDIVITVLDELPSIVDSIIRGIFAAIQRLAERLPELIKGITNMVRGLVNVILTLIFEGIPNLVNEIIRQVPDIVKAIVADLLSTDNWKEVFEGLANAVYDGIKSLFGSGGEITGSEEGDIGLAVGTMGISKFGQMFGLWHQGGMIEDALRAHNGTFVGGGLKSDEVPIIAQTGESVLNRQATASIGGKSGVDALNGGQVGSSVTTNIELKPGIMLAKDAAEVLDEILTERMRQGQSKLAESIQKGQVAGFEPMT